MQDLITEFKTDFPEVVAVIKSKHDMIAEKGLDLDKFIEDMIKKSNPWLSCRAIGGEMCEPMNCFFCPMGHMTECHYPCTCSEAGSPCHHYSGADY